jgi:hypothetical protein
MVKCRGTLIAEVAALGLARTIVLVMLMVIGAILIARGTYSLTT